ncbi:hypothetical protein QJS04_geneDACA010543 [Acorus gramineus]|uniref:GST N-terminal domain-containing protein n=1 Tax=Acorus gramineus TaxID=55184 RepID=A0AAV9ANE8_ACOGR|nr:hypothetical protein QJS04_geneDACA010543 [Acorus gramineus]
MAQVKSQEVLPPILGANSDPPSVFDGTTRLYLSYNCPYAQRVWVARNFKGLQETIKLVPFDLKNRPAWYKEKVYPENKVPALEHNDKIISESLDLLNYVDTHFEGPSLLPNDPVKREFAEELINYSGSFNTLMFTSIKSKGDTESEVGAALGKIEDALSKFSEGPFFLGHFSQVDIAYVPFIERFQKYFVEEKTYDITKGRPKLAQWIEEMNKIEAYTSTKYNAHEQIADIKQRLSIK